MKLIRKAVENLESLGWEEGKPICWKKGDICLLFGENFIPVDQTIKSAIENELDKINMYPEPMGSVLIKKLAEYLGISEKNIVVANGIDDLLNLIAKTFIEVEDEIIVPTPTFPVYSTVTKLMEGNVKDVALDERFKLDINKLIEKISGRTKAIFIANPNNPTGNLLLQREDLKEIIENFDGLIVIDECYYGISNVTFIDMIDNYDNLLILRSFSKIPGLAGLRIGYAVGSRYLIDPMKSVIKNCNPFILDRLAQAAAVMALDCERDIIQKFKKTKADFYQELENIPKIKVIPTETTFLLIDLEKTGITSNEFRRELAKRQIFVKDCEIYGLSERYVRLGIPKKEVMDYVASSIRSIISNDQDVEKEIGKLK